MITNYVIIHNQYSLDWFIQHNADIWHKFNFILVGNESIESGTNYIIARDYKDNIEHLPQLLAFTAWYLIANNNICETEFIGLFEYDVIFSEYPEFEPEENCIYGFVRRMLPDSMYMDAVPEFKKTFGVKMLATINNAKFWNASTNFIMNKSFFREFVYWYYDHLVLGEFMNDRFVAHYHERAINAYASIEKLNNKTLDILTHKELNSHKVRL